MTEIHRNTLRIEQLGKTLKKRRLVQSLSLQVHGGQVVGLLGPNGAGKTTSFTMIAGLIPSDHGNIWLNTHNITHLSIDKRSHLGLSYLPQESSIFRKLSVADNILGILELQKHKNLQERQAQLEHLLNTFQIQSIRNNKGATLSGGERRRVEIARTLATDPKFMLLDEPFAGIDPISIVEIKHIIQKLQSFGVGILITDHNVRETLDVCEKAYIISKGSIIASGGPEDILSNQEVKNVYLGEYFSL